MNLLFLNLGGQEIILIVLLVLILFGGKKIPELMRGLGKGIREFNSARASIESDIKDGMRAQEKDEKDSRKAIEREESVQSSSEDK